MKQLIIITTFINNNNTRFNITFIICKKMINITGIYNEREFSYITNFNQKFW